MVLSVSRVRNGGAWEQAAHLVSVEYRLQGIQTFKRKNPFPARGEGMATVCCLLMGDRLHIGLE